MPAGIFVFISGELFVAGMLMDTFGMPLVSFTLELVDWFSVELLGVF